jgi:cell division protein FtsN
MAKDYKHRLRDKRQGLDPVKNLSVWKWMLITALAISAVVLVVYISGIGLKSEQLVQVVDSEKTMPPETATVKKPEEPKPIQYDFYTILPEKEMVVPEYEIKIRTREERIGQAKATHYIMQAGSYNAAKDAEKMQVKLGAMGIEAKIQKAKIGNALWYRVKMGPFEQIASVNTLNARLKQSGIDAIVTETDK